MLKSKIQTRSCIDFEDTTNFFYHRYKVRKKESADFEIRGVFPWCFEKYTTEKHPRYKKRPTYEVSTYEFLYEFSNIRRLRNFTPILRLFF